MSHSNCMRKTSNIHNRCKSKSPCRTASAGTTYVKTSALSNSPHKVKRLKTRKERNQIRGQERNKSHGCPQHSRKVVSDKAQHRGCRCSHLVQSSKKGTTFAKPFAVQKPSIITEGRLTSIRGLFSHEIKSLDIERLVSQQKNKERRQSVMHITSPIPPQPYSVPESDQDCILDEVQEPVQKPEDNTQLHKETKKCSRKEPRIKYAKGATVHMESPTEEQTNSKSAKNRKEIISNKARSDSSRKVSKETEMMVVPLPDNNVAHQLCSTPVDANKKYFDIPETHSPKSHNEGDSEERTCAFKKGHCLTNIQRLDSTSTMAGFPNMEVSQNKTDPSLSELDSGNGTLLDNDKQWEKISVSVRQAVKRLATGACHKVERRVLNRQRPLLAECREVLLQTLQKRHGFHLQQNLSKLHPLLNRKQTAAFSSGQIQEDCSHIQFSHAVGNENTKHSRSMEIWADNAMQQDYLAEEVKQDSDVGVSKKCREQRRKDFSSPIFPILSRTDTSLQLDQSSTAVLPQDCFRAQYYPKTALFEQDQALFQHASPIHGAPRWADHIYEPISQQLLGDPQRRNESVKHFDLELISHHWKENTDPTLNLYQEYQNRKLKAQEAFLAESNFCSNQLQIHEIIERQAPTSISASISSEGFRYKPFFRFPHPSNSLYRSDWPGKNLSPRLNTLDKAFYHHWLE